jgi:O-antigen ligase
MLFALIVVRALAEPQFKLIHTPLDLPFLLFYGIALLATAIAIVQSAVNTQMAVTEIRYISYYLIFFLVTNLVRDARQVRLLIHGLFMLAILVAIAMFVQLALGQSVQILGGRVEPLVTEGVRRSEIIRITNFGGEALIMTAFILRITIFAVSGTRGIGLMAPIQVALFGVAVIMTYNRNFWIGAFLAILIVTYQLSKVQRGHLLKSALAAAVLGSLLLLPIFFQPASRAGEFLAASVERAASLLRPETVWPIETSTLRWRDFEYHYALPQVLENPLLGLGLGAQYRPFVRGIDHANFDGRGYTHNAHLWIILKTGLLGYASLLWLSLLFLWRGFRYWRMAPTPLLQGTMLGSVLTYIGVLLGSIVNPMLMQWYWMPIIGILMGLNEVIIRLSLHPKSQPAAQLPANSELNPILRPQQEVR